MDYALNSVPVARFLASINAVGVQCRCFDYPRALDHRDLLHFGALTAWRFLACVTALIELGWKKRFNISIIVEIAKELGHGPDKAQYA